MAGSSSSPSRCFLSGNSVGCPSGVRHPPPGTLAEWLNKGSTDHSNSGTFSTSVNIWEEN
eukprot:1182089-Prorocentrum_minimum.AAC.1